MSLPTIPITIIQYVNNETIQLRIVNTLIDTGSEKSLISSKCLDLSPFHCENISPLNLKNAANNQMATINQSITVNVKVEKSKLEFPLRKLYVVPET